MSTPSKKPGRSPKGDSVVRYRVPPKTAFRRMGLGVLKDGHIKVIAGFHFRWWVPDYCGPLVPLFVNARVLRDKRSVEQVAAE